MAPMSEPRESRRPLAAGVRATADRGYPAHGCRQDYVTRRAGKASPGTTIKEANVRSICWGWPSNGSRPIQSRRENQDASDACGPGSVYRSGRTRTLIDACPDWLRPIVILAAFTGMRRSEIFGLRWMHVDLAGNRLILAQTKNGEGGSSTSTDMRSRRSSRSGMRTHAGPTACSGSRTTGLPTTSARG